MNLQVIFIVVALLGIGIGTMAGPLVRYMKRYGATRIILWDPDKMTVRDRWKHLRGKAPTVKIDGKAAKPLLAGNYRHESNGSKPCFILNTRNGLPMRIEDRPEILRALADDESQAVVWPTAYDVAEMYADGREERISNSSRDKGADYAKWGAIAGGVAVFLMVVMLGLVFQMMRATGIT